MKQALCCLVLFLVPSGARAELIVNGNFEQGYVGFTTEYRRGPDDLLGAAGDYLIGFNPSNHHPSGADYGDHTTGMGLMMMVNEASTQRLVWGQAVAVTPNTTYHFSAFISSWVSAAPSRLDVQFNGVSIGVMNAPPVTGVWVEFAADWNSGSATALTIGLRNLTTADVGGDFALDDLSLTGPQQIEPIPEPLSLLLALTGLGMLGSGWLRRKYAGSSATDI